jgi:hypothetical protein
MPEPKFGMKSLYQASLDPSEREVRRLFWRDDMENYNVCKWIPSYPVGGTVAYVNTPISAFEGDYVLRANHPTATYYDIVSPTFGCFKPQKMSCEMRWWKDATTRHTGMAMFYRPTTGVQLRSGIRWEGRWQYLNVAGNYEDIPGGSEAIIDDSWNYLKIMVDWENRRYSRLITNFLDLDLTTVLPDPTLPVLTGTLGQFYIVLFFWKTAVNQPSYVDDVRLYLNEV